MNVIFLDFDGVINTYHNNSNENIEKRIKILSDICKKYNSKVVISSSIKDAIDDSMDTDVTWVKNILNLFKKYDIDCIGKTKTIGKQMSEYVFMPVWKEDEILDYLSNHKEIEHFCVIDDYDAKFDLEKVWDNLVKTSFYSDDPSEEGLLDSHDSKIGNVLQKDNIKRILSLKK